MKQTAMTLALLLLTACSGAPSGTYAAVDPTGKVMRSTDGTPGVSISLDDGNAIFRIHGEEPVLGQYKVIKDSVFLTLPSEPETIELKRVGDTLRSVKHEQMQFVKL